MTGPMAQRILAAVAVLGLALGGLAVAQEPAGEEPPLRLKKKGGPEQPAQPPEEKPAVPEKERPKEAEPGKKTAGKDEEGPERLKGQGDPGGGGEPEVNEEEVLNRVGKNMRLSEDRLANRELTDATRQVQEDIVKDLDELLNRLQNGGGVGGGQDQQQNQDQNQDQQKQDQEGGQKGQGGSKSGRTKLGMSGGKQKGSQGGQSARRPWSSRGSPQARNQGGQPQGGQPKGGQQPGEAQAKAGDKPQKPTGNGNEGGGGGRSQGESNRLADIYKDIWGHLPETKRAEMDAYSREQFMARYNDLIRQYYTTIAEKGRRKGDQ